MAWGEPDFSVEADAERHWRPCSERRRDGRADHANGKGVKRARAVRLSFGSEIADITATTASVYWPKVQGSDDVTAHRRHMCAEVVFGW